MIDHDRLFKELLTTFFVEFLDLFLPNLSAALDPNVAIVALDKEIFTDVTPGDKHEVDILMKARLQDQGAFFLIHVENQSSPQTDFQKRMFRCFARLTEKYDLPVYPIVIFSYDAPQRPESSRFVATFPQKTILRFDYTVIQLNRLPWRRFVRQENPVASALMAKMKMSVKDRPKVKAECLRLLATLKLDPARTKLIGGFVDSYLKLSAEEMNQYKRAIAEFTPTEKEAAMEITTSWHQEGRTQGISQGISQGKESLVLRQLRRRVGPVPDTLTARFDTPTATQLDDLGEALLDFQTPADLQQWLDRHSPQAALA